ncbi:MAG: winged helix-turn-helix domain-containing protein, partial [Pseudomonadota bacterium]
MVPFRIGNAQIRPDELRIEANGIAIDVEPKVMTLLLELSFNAQAVVSRADLIERVWQREFGSDESLTRAISLLRKAFREVDGQREYIKTIPKRGYQLIAPLEHTDGHAGAIVNSTKLQTRITRSNLRRGFAGFAILVCFASIWGWLSLREQPMEHEAPIIAVLPLQNIGEDEQDYLSDGFAEEIMNKLTGLEGIRVAGRSSSFALAKSEDDALAVGRQLNAKFVMEGTLQKSDDLIRVNVQLVDVKDGTLIWSNRFDKQMTEAFEVQDAIADSVARAIGARVLPTRDYSPDPRAYVLYLRALHKLRRSQIEGNEGAVALFEDSVGIDPNYGPSHAALAVAYTEYALRSRDETESTRDKAMASAQKALQFNPNSAMALTAIAAVKGQRQQWVESRRLYEQAIAIDPAAETPTVHLWTLMTVTGDKTGRNALIEGARELNPNSTALALVQSFAAFDELDFERAVEFGRQAKTLGGISIELPVSLAILGQNEEALEVYEDMIKDWPTPEVAQTNQRRLLRSFNDEEARQNFIERIPDLPDSWSAFVRIMGRPDIADLHRSPQLPGYYQKNPIELGEMWLDIPSEMRASDSFKAELIALGLPDYWRTYDWPDACKPVGEDDFFCT